VGCWLIGPSGIGKSESALELVTRGHRLIADDMVIVHRARESFAHGKRIGPRPVPHGDPGVGIVDVKELFGVASILSSKEIELVVNWRAGKPPRSMTVSGSRTITIGS